MEEEPAGSTAAAVLAELQAVLEQACGALQAQEEGRVHDAVQGYFLARSRVHYVKEALLRPLVEGGDCGEGADAAVAAATCALLQETYSAAIERLTGCASSDGEAVAEEEEEEADGSAASEGCAQLLPGGGDWGGGARGAPRRAADAGQVEARRRAGAGGSGGGSGGKEQQGLVALGRRCLREVQGSLDEVVGLDAIKQELREAVLLPMRFPPLFTGLRRPQVNVMLHGVPGTGKTLLVEKLAAEAGTPLLAVSPSAILSKWAGESEKTLRGVFEAAAALAPAIIFLDEVDSLAPTRSSGDDLAARRVLTELLIQMTAAAERPDRPVYVMAATNRLGDLDPALLRRFERTVEVPPPDAAARVAFFASAAARPEFGAALSEAELAQLAAATNGCTGSDLAAMCREAAMVPVRELLTGWRCGGGSGGGGNGGGLQLAHVRPVGCADLLAAIAKLAPTAAPVSALPEALAALEVSPARDVAAAAFAVAGSVALIKFFDTLERFEFIDKKLSRKLVHMLAGPGFIACWPLFGAEPYSRLLAACVPALNALRLLLIGNGIVKDERAVSAMSRTGDAKELLRGPLYYVLILIAITAIYWRCSPVGLVIASLMCGGDGLADVVGRRLGSGNPLPWNPEKSWAGSAAMFLGGLGMSAGLISLFCSQGYLECDMPATAAAVAVIALAATVVESLPVNRMVDDNLSVPGVAAFLGVLFLQASWRAPRPGLPPTSLPPALQVALSMSSELSWPLSFCCGLRAAAEAPRASSVRAVDSLPSNSPSRSSNAHRLSLFPSLPAHPCLQVAVEVL
ncbi:hypothetical protein ABPG75_011965 [Micractinium tetrahymenae]